MNKESTKKIGLWNIVGLGVGGAVGSGIFVTLGSAIAKTGRSILPITIICVFYMLLAYWYNLAMSGIFIIEGGDYSMKGMLLPPLLTGYGGWSNVIWAFGFTGYALSLTSYLSSLWPALAEHRQLSSAILLTLFFLLAIKGRRLLPQWFCRHPQRHCHHGLGLPGHDHGPRGCGAHYQEPQADDSHGHHCHLRGRLHRLWSDVLRCCGRVAL